MVILFLLRKVLVLEISVFLLYSMQVFPGDVLLEVFEHDMEWLVEATANRRRRQSPQGHES